MKPIRSARSEHARYGAEEWLELTEGIIAAHKAAIRAGDRKALALLEPLIRHAGDLSLTAFASSVAEGRCGLCSDDTPERKPSAN